MKNVKLTDLISVEILQQIQDGFSRYTGMAALTTDSDGVPVTNGSGFTHFCMDLTRQSDLGCVNCEQCDKNGALLTLNNKHATVYDCHAGLIDFAAPIMVEGNFIGSFIGGQVRTAPVDEEKMRERAELYGIDPDEYIAAAKKTTCLPKEDIIKAAQYLEEIAAALSTIAYKSYVAIQKSIATEKAAKSQADYILSMSLNIENTMKTWSDVIENTKSSTYDNTLYELLTEMQNEGQEIRLNIGETIDYIRATASKVEIIENDYDLHELAEHIRENVTKTCEKSGVTIKVVVADDATRELFGDAGRICQLVTRVSRSIMENKLKGELVIELSTHVLSYSTMLDIRIIDKDSGYNEEELEFIKKVFKKRRRVQSVSDSPILNTLDSMLLKRIDGKYSFEETDGDIIIKISAPQLELRGGD